MAAEPLDGLLEQYRVELAGLNYDRGTIRIYAGAIERLFGLMAEHGVALSELTPDVAAELVLRPDCRGSRHQYGVFIVKRFCGV